MKTELEREDIQAIAMEVAGVLKPLIARNKREDEDIIFDVESLAVYLKVSTKWIYERTHLKEIPHKKVKGMLRFRKKDIDKWIDSHNVPAVDTPGRILKAIK